MQSAIPLPGNPQNGPIVNPYTYPERMLRGGDIGDDVRWVQFSLAIAGYHVEIDGFFGTTTERAILQLQTDLGLVTDGVVGPEMRAVLSAALGNAPTANDTGVTDRIPDISVYQGDIAWPRAASETLFAIVRVQLGSAADILFERNAAYMNAYRIPFGVYGYLRADSVTAARQEARLLFERASPVSPRFYVCDVEDQLAEDMRAVTAAYIAELRNLGVNKTGLYVAHHQYLAFDLDIDQADFLWIPRYGPNNGFFTINPAFPCDLHQYTSRGQLSGIDGVVDLNRLTGRLPLRFFIT